MSIIEKIISENNSWAKGVTGSEPQFFKESSKGQSPQVLWIGCSDSRIPGVSAGDTTPGNFFTHRNIANVVTASDNSVNSVLEYGLGVLKIPNVVLCGHYGCGGVNAALSSDGAETGAIGGWLKNIKSVLDSNSSELNGISDDDEKFRRACELNAIGQSENLKNTEVIKGILSSGQELSIYTLIYDLETGLLKEL